MTLSERSEASASESEPPRKGTSRAVSEVPQAIGIAGVAQLVERNLAKVDVTGSNPASRSINY